MKRFIVILASFFLTSEIQAQSNLQIQAKKVFEEAIQPNEKGSVRYLHKTTREYDFFGDCLELEDKSKFIKELKGGLGDISVLYQYVITDTEAYYRISCYEGYDGGIEFIVDIRSLNKDLLTEVGKLVNEYFEQYLVKQSDGKFLLGIYQTYAPNILKDKGSDEWYMWLRFIK